MSPDDEDRAREIAREEIYASKRRDVEAASGAADMGARISAILAANRRARDERTPALLIEAAAKRLGDVVDLLEHGEAPGAVFAAQVREIQRELRVLVDELLERVVDVGEHGEEGVMHDSSPAGDGQPLQSAEGSVARTVGGAADIEVPGVGVAAALSTATGAAADLDEPLLDISGAEVGPEHPVSSVSPVADAVDASAFGGVGGGAVASVAAAPADDSESGR